MRTSHVLRGAVTHANFGYGFRGIYSPTVPTVPISELASITHASMATKRPPPMLFLKSTLCKWQTEFLFDLSAPNPVGPLSLEQILRIQKQCYPPSTRDARDVAEWIWSLPFPDHVLHCFSHGYGYGWDDLFAMNSTLHATNLEKAKVLMKTSQGHSPGYYLVLYPIE